MSAAAQLEHTSEYSGVDEENRLSVARQKEWARLCMAAAKGRPSIAYRPPPAVFGRTGDRHTVSARRSQWCQALLKLQGERYRLNRWHETEHADEAKRAWELREIDPVESRQIVERLEQFGRAERREYIYPVLDSSLNRALLMCARQVEKTVHKGSTVSMEDGSPKRIENIELGDRVVGLSQDEAHTEVGTVTWKSEEYTKPCIRVTTRQGHTVVIALTHPMRGWQAWPNGSQLAPGARLAVVRQGGVFTGNVEISDQRVCLTAYLLGDGYLGKKDISFCSLPGAKLNEFLKYLDDIGGSANTYSPERTDAVYVDIHRGSPLDLWLEEDELRGVLSADKHVPAWVFGLGKAQTALFLNRLWSTDGRAAVAKKGYYDIYYTTASWSLARHVQSLLHKFRIPTSAHEFVTKCQPSIRVRVETREGVRTFLSEIGALEKSEKLPLPPWTPPADKYDTFPLGIWEQVRRIYKSHPVPARQRRKSSLFPRNLRKSSAVPLTRWSLRHYIDFFRADDRFDQELVTALAAHLDTDLFWDEVVEIGDLGDQPCYDIAVAGTESFVADGFITHNSTLCSAITVTESAMYNFFRTLYVSPSAQQTRTFSNEKLSPLLQYSPMIKKYWRDTSCRDQVFEQSYINGSFTFLRYCFLTADRARGIPADRLLIDEIQDILSSNIRIIEECLSHSKYGWSLYAGTPKTLENTIQQYWEYSNQNEWMIPCSRCVPVGGGKRYWNNLDVDSIGDNGVICKNCGRGLDVNAGMWIVQNPKGTYNGFRISQLMVPWKFTDPDRWRDEIVWKLENYEEGEFHNEVLGISFDNASKPIKRAELVACCWPSNQVRDFPLENWIYDPTDAHITKGIVFMGIDWGEGRGGRSPDGRVRKASYTVVSIGAWHGAKLAVIYQKRYEGKQADKDFVFMDVCRLIRKYNVTRVAADAGHGWGINSDLFRELGDEKIVQIRYVPHQREYAKWDPLAFCVLIDRTYAMSEALLALKRQEYYFPPWSIAEEFLRDAEHLYADYRDKRKNEMYYDHTEPDDAFQSLVYLRLAVQLHFNELIPNHY